MEDTRTKSTVLIDDIKPDPSQPRKIVSIKHIDELAINIQTIGMINPIELDINMVIITGECRWRAAKKAGWTEVPVIINNVPLAPYDRLRRQVSENFLQSGGDKGEMMNAVDTAKGFGRLLILKAYKRTKIASPGTLSFQTGFLDKLNFKDDDRMYQAISAYSNKELIDIYHSIPREVIYGLVKELCEETGIIDKTVQEHLDLLSQPEFVIMDIQGGRPRTYYREANKAPEKVREQIKEKIAKGDYASRTELRDDINLSRRNPDLALVELERQKAKESTATNKILNGIVRLGLALEAHPLDKVEEHEKSIVTNQLKWIGEKITAYLALEGKIV